MDYRKTAKRAWKFIWDDDSVWSWIVNIILAFVLIKFIVYPGLGFILGTTHPVVAVVSESMEHNQPYDDWWVSSNWYAEHGITKEQFSDFKMRNGFAKGDIIVLGSTKNVKVGDIIVFQTGKPDPIIHRVVAIWEEDGKRFYGTKGDNWRTNSQPIRNPVIDETRITEQQLIGKAILKIPYLGYIKIWFVEVINILRAAVT